LLDLDEIFDPNRVVAAARLTVAGLPPEWRIVWEERAAVREYLGGQAREHAEAEALREIANQMHRRRDPV
jgi:hypothetical protein